MGSSSHDVISNICVKCKEKIINKCKHIKFNFHENKIKIGETHHDFAADCDERRETFNKFFNFPQKKKNV